VKPLALIMVPLLALMTAQRGPKAVLSGVAGTLLALLGGLGYFLAQGMGLELWENYRRLFREALEKVSFGAWNLWWPAQSLFKARPQQELLRVEGFALTYEDISIALMAGVVLLVIWLWLRRRGPMSVDPMSAVLAASFLALAFFMLPVAVHSRYLLYFLALGAPLVLLAKRWLALYLALSATAFLNVYAVLPDLRAGGPMGFKLAPPISLMSLSISLPVTVVNIVLFCVFLVFLIRGFRPSTGRAHSTNRPDMAGVDSPEKG